MSRESYLARERAKYHSVTRYAEGLAIGAAGTGLLRVPWWHSVIIAAGVSVWAWLRLPKEAR